MELSAHQGGRKELGLSFVELTTSGRTDLGLPHLCFCPTRSGRHRWPLLIKGRSLGQSRSLDGGRRGEDSQKGKAWLEKEGGGERQQGRKVDRTGANRSSPLAPSPADAALRRKAHSRALPLPR